MIMRSSLNLLGHRNSLIVPHFPRTLEANSPLIYHDAFLMLFQRFLQPRGFSRFALEPNHQSISNAFAANCDAAAADLLMEQNGFALDRKLVVGTLKSLYTRPEAAFNFFNWASRKESQRLSSKEYNLMLRILGSNGMTSDFWNLTSIMKEKGYEISTGDRRGKSKNTDSISCLLKSSESSNKVSMLIRSRIWGEELEKEIREMGLDISSDHLKNTIENLAVEPTKALIFFRWTEEMVKHDSTTYNAIARVLTREDCIDRFWKILNEMNTNAYKIEPETYIKAANHFLRKKLYKEAVDITAHAISSQIDVPHSTFTHLLKKISSAKEFDADLFTRVANLMQENKVPLSKSTVISVLKSLTSVKRMSELTRILEIMKAGGLVIEGDLEKKIANYVTKHCGGETEAIAGELSGKAKIEGYCNAGKLREAKECFRALLGGNERDAFHSLIAAYCRKSGRIGFEFMTEEHQLKPLRKSYVALIHKLAEEGAYLEAVQSMGMMRMNGYRPSIAPLMEYLKTAGTVDDAAALMEAAGPSPKLGAEIFRELFEIGRYEEARGFFRKCGRSFRRNTGVLSMLADSMQNPS